MDILAITVGYCTLLLIIWHQIRKYDKFEKSVDTHSMKILKEHNKELKTKDVIITKKQDAIDEMLVDYEELNNFNATLAKKYRNSNSELQRRYDRIKYLAKKHNEEYILTPKRGTN